MVNLQSIQTEVDASYLYDKLAKNESDQAIASIFAEMSEIEMGHAISFLKANKMEKAQLPGPSGRAKILNRIGKIFGYDYVLGVLLDVEKGLAQNVARARKTHAVPAALNDTAHVRILKNIINNNTQLSGPQLARFEKQHRSVGGNALRAAVLDCNDGLVSNFSLVMGIAGATNGSSDVLLTGLAGLLAGALSMSLGEWISVKSSQELTENQMQLEMDELENNPDGEEREIALIYQAKGIAVDDAKRMASELMRDKDKAHQLLVSEELGINVDELEGSAMEAAVYSFLLFAVGAIIPVIPFFFTSGYTAIIASAVLSGFGLFLIGASITLFTSKNVWFSGFRQVIFGLAAAAITFGIGKLIGVSIAG